MKYKSTNMLDQKFKALANPTRREILIMLSQKSLYASEIAKEFSISFASISHHLQKLEASKLIISKRKGQYKQYSLCIEELEEISLWITNLI